MERMPLTFRVGGSRVPQARILCYGDSLTAGFAKGGRVFAPYGEAMAEALEKFLGACEVKVCGHTGHLAREMLANLNAEVVEDPARRQGKGLLRILEENPGTELVLIMAGTNDLGNHRQPREILADIAALHYACHERGVRTVVLAPPLAPVGLGSSWERRRNRLRDLLADWAGRCAKASFLDVSELLPPQLPGAWDPDGLHFSPAGSRLLGERLAAFAPRLLAPPTARQLPSPRMPVAPERLAAPPQARTLKPLPSPRIARRDLKASWGGC